MANGETGYGYTPDALSGVTNQLRQGAGTLDGVAKSPPQGVDAGASSAAVGQALNDLMRMATAAAQVMDDSAGKVHTANGSYDEIENNHAGQLRLNDQQDTPDDRRESHVHG